MLPAPAWVLSGFLPRSNNMHVRQMGEPELSLGLNKLLMVVCCCSQETLLENTDGWSPSRYLLFLLV